MSMKLRRLEFGSALCAFLIAAGVPGATNAESHRITDPAPPEVRPLELECLALAIRVHPCHVHRPETFDRLPKNDPALSDPHAREEYINHMKARSRNRDRSGVPRR